MDSTENLPASIKHTSRKRTRTTRCDADDLPAAKLPRMMTVASKRFDQKCWEWHERRRKITLGLTLYWEARVRDARRLARKRASSEMYADYEGLVKCKYAKLLQETFTNSKIPSSLSTSVATSLSTSVSSSILAAKETAEASMKIEDSVSKEVSVLAPERRVIRRLLDNVDAKEAPGVKITTVPRRNGWRQKGEKRT